MKILKFLRDVPIQKCFKFNNFLQKNNNCIRFYSTISEENTKSIQLYEDAYLMKKSIIKDNKNKSGIYK
jgi:hypothetical protein